MVLQISRLKFNDLFNSIDECLINNKNLDLRNNFEFILLNPTYVKEFW